MSYWDSSALLKLYVKEADSAVFENFVTGAARAPVISRLGIYEMETVLRRKESEGTLTVGSALRILHRLIQDVKDGHVIVIEFGGAVEQKFRDVLDQCFKRRPPLFIRTLDGIHLSSALAGAESELIATDKRMRDAALAIGLKLFP